MSHLVEEVRSRRRLPEPAVARAIRLAAGASQEELARELGVHRVTVTRWEKGLRRPRRNQAAAYLRLLDELRDAATSSWGTAA